MAAQQLYATMGLGLGFSVA